MKFLGFELTRVKKALSYPWGGWHSWWPIVREPFTGAWQRNRECTTEDLLSHPIVWACIKLISGDISKIDVTLVRRTEDDIWIPYENTAHSPLLREPNHFQTRLQFFESWVLSKLIHGNTYVLKARDERRVVTRMYVLDPTRVQPLVADDGQIFYKLSTDNLAGLQGDGQQLIVPASEIMHDRSTPAYHSLIGISPLRAIALAAIQGLRIQRMSSDLFENHAQPSGVLTSAQTLSPEQAAEIQNQWQSGFTGPNQGKVAVLGADLKYQQLAIKPIEAQLVEQMNKIAEFICSVFGIPPYMVGAAPAPPYNNVQALQIQYLQGCLQVLIENIEELLVRGLELPSNLRVEFDEDSFLRMDTATLVQAARDAVASGAMSPNEARRRFYGLHPVSGGETPYLLQQNFSLEALAKRDSQADPFAVNTASQSAARAASETEGAASPAPEKSITDQVMHTVMGDELIKGLLHAAA